MLQGSKDAMGRPAGPVAASAAGADASRADARMRLSVLGATGSIGTSTLALVQADPDAFEVVALTANANAEALARSARAVGARLAVISDETRYASLKEALAGSGIEAAAGAEAVVAAAREPADCVMAAIMGAAGLAPSLAAVGQGTRVALANKECLVAAGALFMAEVARSGCELLPVDSEHSAVYQALNGERRASLERVILTASGGPFRTWTAEAILKATPEQALRHPNWSMGQKISIDSATLMNKGLELIEAHHLFQLTPDELDVVVHPQSIVHSLVTFRDGSMIAQLGAPDMRTPISYALAWPERMSTATARVDLATIGALTFEPPDLGRFPALGLARAALAAGGGMPVVLNAANEVAVAAFLARKIRFGDIATTVERAIELGERERLAPPERLEDVLAIDARARDLARVVIDRVGSR